MVRFEFSDTDWLTMDALKVYRMSELNQLTTNRRLSDAYLPPIITEDTFNGITYPVQINIWECYTIDLALKETALQLLPKIQSCSYLKVTDLASGISFIADTQSSGAIVIEPGEKFATTNQTFRITLRANKTRIYPKIAKENMYSIKTSVNSSIYPYAPVYSYYYTDILPQEIVMPGENETIIDNNQVQFHPKRSMNKGIIMCLYHLEAAAIAFKANFEISDKCRITTNDLDLTVLENVSLEQSEIVEGLYKSIVTFIYESKTRYFV